MSKKYFVKQLEQENQHNINPASTLSHSRSESINFTRSKALSKSKEERKSTNKNENQIVRTLLMVSFSFLILTMPYYVKNIVYIFYNENTSLEKFILLNFLWHVTGKIFILNNAINFFLYILGGKKFREDVKNLFSCFKTIRSTKGESDMPTVSSTG